MVIALPSPSCCCILIPRHHSALSTDVLPKELCRRLILAVDHRCRKGDAGRANNPTTSASASDSASDSASASDCCSTSSAQRISRYYCNVLILQCHSEGVMWKGFAPLLMKPPQPQPGNTDSYPGGTKDPNINSSATVEKGTSINGKHDDDGVDGSNNECRQSTNGSRKRKKREGSKGASSSRRALSLLLMHHFRNHVRTIAIDDGDTVPATTTNKCNKDDNTHLDNGQFTSTDDVSNWSTRMQFYNNATPHSSSKTASQSNNNNNNSITTTTTIILLLPPNPRYETRLQYYSRTPSASPANPFALRLIHNENTYIRLTSLSAYISTLGGGFFLCKYLSTAVFLARSQCHIAYLRGDTEMALKCRINEGYCFIHAGKLNRGKKVIRRVLGDVLKMQREKRGGGGYCSDSSSSSSSAEEATGNALLLEHTAEKELDELTIIRNMCYSALRFANLIRQEAEKSGSGIIPISSSDNGDELRDQHSNQGNNGSSIGGDGGINNEEKISLTHDDFQRIRIVRDRKWR